MGAKKSCRVISAMMVLHNIAVRNRDVYEPLPEGLDVQGHDDNADNSNAAGRALRQHYVQTYFS